MRKNGCRNERGETSSVSSNGKTGSCNCTVFHRTIAQGFGMAPALSRTRLTKKISRIEARLNPEQKRRIEYAASLKGTSISDFMVSSADDAAVHTIQQHETWSLTGRDREIVVEALLNPPAPSIRMKAALRRYRRRVKAL